MPSVAQSRRSDPSWLRAAFSYEGIHEAPGSGQDNPKIMAMYADVGFAWVEHDETAWCAAFAGAMLGRSGMPFEHSLAARSYEKWGKPTRSPKRGDIVVFERGGSGWQGHVAFFLAETAGTVTVIGGNQSNAVTVATFKKRGGYLRLLGYRTPVKAHNSRTAWAQGLVATGAGAAAGGNQIAGTMSDAGLSLQSVGGMSKWIDLAGALLIVGGVVWTLYARLDDWRTKGR